MVNRPAAPTGAASQSSAAAESEVLKQKKANETQQAVVLFIIVLASTRVLLLAWLFREEFWDILRTSSIPIIGDGDGGGIRSRCLRERIIEPTIPFVKILVYVTIGTGEKYK